MCSGGPKVWNQTKKNDHLTMLQPMYPTDLSECLLNPLSRCFQQFSSTCLLEYGDNFETSWLFPNYGTRIMTVLVCWYWVMLYSTYQTFNCDLDSFPSRLHPSKTILPPSHSSPASSGGCTSASLEEAVTSHQIVAFLQQLRSQAAREQSWCLTGTFGSSTHQVLTARASDESLLTLPIIKNPTIGLDPWFGRM